MKRKLIPVLVANLFAASAALAADVGGMNFTGSASVGYRGLKDTATDGFKLNEYRDLGSSTAIGVLDVRGSSENYFLNFFGENFGRDDQYLDLKGGKYGYFKYGLYDDKMTHNLGFGLSTP